MVTNVGDGFGDGNGDLDHGSIGVAFQLMLFSVILTQEQSNLCL